MSPTSPRVNLNSLSARIDGHEERIEDLEKRMEKYDAILVRLDVLIDVLTRRVEGTADRAETAIDGQELLKEKNESAYRWSMLAVGAVSSIVTGMVVVLIAYLWPLIVH